MLKVNLDRQNDILYIAFADMTNSYGDENEGVITFHDLLTEKVTGVTIFDFLEKYYNNQIQQLNLPVTIDFVRDVYPLL